LDGLNFLDQQIAGCVERRARAVQRAGGTLDLDRLRRNLLSSMPLCFNLFGKFRVKRPAAARVLGAMLDLDIATIDEVLIEHAPVAAKQLLGDRTAFDAFVAYTTSTGAKGFLGVETKYTEPFGPIAYPASHYQHSLAYRAAGFRKGASNRLCRPATNQLWRNTLLAVATRHAGGYDLGHAVVIAGRDDAAAWKAVAAVRAELHDPDGLLRSVSLQRLIEQCQLQRALAEWAVQFRRRYLDLSPLAHHVAVPAPPGDRPVVPLGTWVSGRPDGWDRKGQPDGPELTGIPDVVSGALRGWLVDEPDQGIYYFKHIVSGVDVDSTTIEVAADGPSGQVSPPTTDEPVQRLAAHCRAVLGDLTLLPQPPGYPDSLALCVLDAIWSMGVRYTAVQHVIGRYRQHRRSLAPTPTATAWPTCSLSSTTRAHPRVWLSCSATISAPPPAMASSKPTPSGSPPASWQVRRSTTSVICGQPSAGTGRSGSKRTGEGSPGNGPALAGATCCCLPTCRRSSQTG